MAQTMCGNELDGGGGEGGNQNDGQESLSKTQSNRPPDQSVPTKKGTENSKILRQGKRKKIFFLEIISYIQYLQDVKSISNMNNFLFRRRGPFTNRIPE